MVFGEEKMSAETKISLHQHGKPALVAPHVGVPVTESA